MVLADGQVAAGTGAAGQGEPQRVRAERLDPVERVDAVALGLAHLAAELVADQTVQEDVLERHLRPARTASGIASSSPTKVPNIIMRATQKNRMS